MTVRFVIPISLNTGLLVRHVQEPKVTMVDDRDSVRILGRLGFRLGYFSNQAFNDKDGENDKSKGPIPKTSAV